MDLSPIRDLPPVNPASSVERCFRCGRPAEEPSAGTGHVVGQDVERMPLCIDCLAVCINDPKVYWAGMPKRQ